MTSSGHVPLLISEEMNHFYSSLFSLSSELAILALVPAYSDEYALKSLDADLPMLVADIYKPEYIKLNYSELLLKASEITLNVSAAAAVVAEKTRDQAISCVWFRMHAGRITVRLQNQPIITIIEAYNKHMLSRKNTFHTTATL